MVQLMTNTHFTLPTHKKTELMSNKNGKGLLNTKIEFEDDKYLAVRLFRTERTVSVCSFRKTSVALLTWGQPLN